MGHPSAGQVHRSRQPVKSLGTAPGFHHVAIRAVDFDETIRFYTEGLGFRVHFPFAVPGRIDRAAFLDAGDGRFVEVFGQSPNQAEASCYPSNRRRLCCTLPAGRVQRRMLVRCCRGSAFELERRLSEQRTVK